VATEASAALETEWPTREEMTEKFIALDALRNLLHSVLASVHGSSIDEALSQPWREHITDDLVVGKLTTGTDGAETDTSLAHQLWPPAVELEDQAGFLLASARGQILAARVLQAAAADPAFLLEQARSLIRSATRAFDKVEIERATEMVTLDGIRAALHEMNDLLDDA
jgi:hypothetical protein